MWHEEHLWNVSLLQTVPRHFTILVILPSNRNVRHSKLCISYSELCNLHLYKLMPLNTIPLRCTEEQWRHPTICGCSLGYLKEADMGCEA
jgi:hypothetical protein